MKTYLILILMLSFSLRILGGNHISPEMLNILRKIDESNNIFQGHSRESIMEGYPYEPEFTKFENLSNLKFGMSQSQVENIFGKDFLYQFKMSKDDVKYKCVSWFFIRRGNIYLFIFKNDKLDSVIRPPLDKFRITKKYLRGKLVNFQESIYRDPLERIEEALDAKSLSLTEFRSNVIKTIPQKIDKTNPLVSLGASIALAGVVPGMKKDYSIQNYPLGLLFIIG